MTDWLDDLYLDRQLWGANPVPCSAGHYLGNGSFHGFVIHHDVIPWVPSSNAADVARHARRQQTIRPDLPGNADGSPESPYGFGIAEHADINKAFTVELRGVGRSGAHTAGHNFSRYGIVLFGDRTDRPLTPGMIAAIRHLGARLFDGRKAEPTLGHRDTVGTACPGNATTLDALQPPFTTPKDDDMDQATFSTMLAHAFGGTAHVGLDGRVYVTASNGENHPLGSMVVFTHQEAQRAASGGVSSGEIIDELKRRL